MTRVNKERYRIQGKTYYKESEEQINESDKGLVDAIWVMSNPKKEQFKLLIRKGKSSTYTLYDLSNRRVLQTYSISKIEG